MKCGIIGPPNVGKSSLFNTLIKKEMAEVANYAFCTINPNMASVEYHDHRLYDINSITKASKIIPTFLSFVDIAGIIKNAASEGLGLGNKFLSEMTGVDVIIQVVRCFEKDYLGNSGDIQGDTDPINDMEYILLELIYWDHNIWKKFCENKKNAHEFNHLLTQWFNKEPKPIREFLPTLGPKELEYYQKTLKNLSLISDKPMIIACNISHYDNDLERIIMVEEQCKKYNLPMTIICGNSYNNIKELSEEDKKDVLSMIGLQDDGIDNLIALAFQHTGLIQFFTTGEKETRAWRIVKGYTAQQAAGVIHEDISNNFINAEVLHWDTFMSNNGWDNCKQKGLIKVEGKNYIVQDGDILVFKHGAKKK